MTYGILKRLIRKMTAILIRSGHVALSTSSIQLLNVADCTSLFINITDTDSVLCALGKVNVDLYSASS